IGMPRCRAIVENDLQSGRRQKWPGDIPGQLPSPGMPLGHANAAYDLLIRKSSFLSLVPFISSRIQTGVTPRPDQRIFGSLRERYFGVALRRVPFRPLTARITFVAFAEAKPDNSDSFSSK